MEPSGQKHQSVDTLLAVMSEQMKTLLKSVDNIEKKLENKVDITSFRELKESFEDNNKETYLKINDHSVKIGIGAALMTAGSWVISLIK